MHYSESNSNLPSVFAVFPGQGSQTVGMGKDLYDNFSFVREIFEEASDAISLNLKKLCFDGPQSDLQLTENTQPCLLVTSVASFRAAERELGFAPAMVAGHSLGEYSALVAVGSLDLGVATRWVRARGLAMQEAVPAGEGSMAAIVGMEDAVVESLCKKASEIAKQKRDAGENLSLQVMPIVEPANFNAPGQIVIAGSSDAILEAISLVKTSSDFAGGKAIPLQVSAPFHCQLMGPARNKMAEIFSQATEAQKPKTPLCAYIPNRTARPSKERNLVFELLVEQVDHPVLWRQSVVSLMEAGFTSGVEFGPGKVLGGLIKRIAAAEGKTCTVVSVNDTSSLKNLAQSRKES